MDEEKLTGSDWTWLDLFHRVPLRSESGFLTITARCRLIEVLGPVRREIATKRGAPGTPSSRRSVDGVLPHFEWSLPVSGSMMIWWSMFCPATLPALPPFRQPRGQKFSGSVTGSGIYKILQMVLSTNGASPKLVGLIIANVNVRCVAFFPTTCLDTS